MIPEQGENFGFVVTDRKYVKKVALSAESEILETYEPIMDMIQQTGPSVDDYEDINLRSADTFFNSTDNLLIYYECFRKTDNQISHIILKYSTIDKKADVIIFTFGTGANPNVWGGEFSSATSLVYIKGGVYKKYIGFAGYTSTIFKVDSESPFVISFEMLEDWNLTLANDYEEAPYRGMSFAATRIPSGKGLPMSFVIFHEDYVTHFIKVDSSSSVISNRVLRYAFFTNVIKEIIKSGDIYFSGDKMIQRKNPKLKLYPLISYSRTFQLYHKDRSPHVMFYDFEASVLYFQTSEDNLFYLDEKQGCYSDAELENVYTYQTQEIPQNCKLVDMFEPVICHTCNPGNLDVEGVCLTITECPTPFFKHGTNKCYKRCPKGYFGVEGGKECVGDCTLLAGGHIFLRDNRQCTKCDKEGDQKNG